MKKSVARILVALVTMVSATVLSTSFASAEAAPLPDATGCNHGACITVKGGPGNYQVFGFLETNTSRYGHFHIWGPNLDYNSPDRTWIGGPGSGTPIQYGYGAGQVCVEFWQYVNGTYVSRGLPCKDVS
ncbi:hypothetical protein [Allokutzneria oryzae]|uniref:Peptidase inhibitor family I36 n=1 Tax=Allokutzneria oryzae TaxID=1378989 RepID=A0ABV6A8Y7_9PSEU